MTTEEVVERFIDARPGFVLASYGEVALPLYRLSLRLQVLEHKRIAPIDEFVLRSVHAGLATVRDIHQALGLDEKLVNSTVIDLFEQDALELKDGAGEQKDEVLALTAQGKQAVADAMEVVSTERIVEVDFDGLLRRPIHPLNTYFEPRDLERFGLREVLPHPNRRPDDAELRDQVRGIEEIARQIGGTRQQLTDVLAVRRLERARRIFQPAVALVYRSAGTRRSQGQVAFAIGGNLSEPHADAFARAGLTSKLGVAKRGIEDATVLAKRVLGAEVVPDAFPEAQTEATDPPTADGVYAIQTYEHPGILKRALETSQSRILLLSPWLKRGVIDKEFLTRLEGALERGVDFYLGWGISASDTEGADADPDVLNALTHLAGAYTNFTFKRLGRTHAKVLLSDDKFVVVTSFNWLSFRGDPKRTFRDERGTMVTFKEHVDEQFAVLAERFRNG